MVDTPVKINNASGGKNNTLCCPECDQIWNRCQCSTRRVDVSGSLLGRIESSSNPKSDSVEDGSDDLKGTVVASKYEIIECLGQGGMGGVYLTEHVTLRKKFALKILRKTLIDDDVVVERLRREAQACAMLTHKNLVSVFDFGITDNGFPYIVMEFIDGVDLTDVIDNSKSMSADRISSLVIKICDGLEAAHAKGVVHRDLKPSNILVTDKGTKNESVRIVDFGIAKSELPGGEMQHLTQTGEVLGSPAYMSPEQIQGLSVDGRSDIYALGCILYEMLTKKQLFRGHTMFATLEANLTQHPPDFSTINNTAKNLEPYYEIMNRCLEKDREVRYQTVSEVREAIEKLGASSSNQASADKNRLVSIGLGVSLLAVVAFGFLFLEPKKDSGTKPIQPEVGEVVDKPNPNDSRFYEKLFEGRVYDLSRNDSKAAKRYKEVFSQSNSLNLKIISAVELLDRRTKDLSKISSSDLTRSFDEIVAVKNKTQKLVENAVRKEDPSLNVSFAAQFYWQVSETMGEFADYYYSLYKDKCKREGTKPLSKDEVCLKPGKVRTSYEKSIVAVRSGIKLLESSEEPAQNLSAFYGRLARHLKHLGKFKNSISNYQKAITLEESSNAPRDQARIISNYFDLVDLYLKVGDLVGAKKTLKMLDQKHKYKMKPADKKKYRKKVKKLNSVD